MLQNIWEQIVQLSASYVPNLLAALSVLVLGWIVALILAAIVRGAMRRTKLDNRLADWMTRDGADRIDIERVMGKVVFYLAMVLVLVAFFEVLNLTVVTEPLNALLSEVGAFAPRILAAAALLLFAWIVATILRKVVSVALRAIDVDRRIGAQAGVAEEEALPLSSTLADAIYWLVFLLFLPAVLGALNIEGLLEPVRGIVDEVLGFLPNLFAAGVVLAAGWFVARLVQRIVTNLLAASGIDAFGERIGLGPSLGTRNLSGLVGLIAYVFILVPVIVAALEALEMDAVTVPAADMLSRFLDAVPLLFAAALLLTVAYFVARLVADLATNVLASAGFDKVMAHIGLGQLEEPVGRRPSKIVGTLIVVAVMLFASIEAAGLLGFDALAGLLSSFAYFVGDVVLGLVVFGIGLYLARLAAEAISASGMAQAGTLAGAARVAIVILAGAMALRQMGVAEDIVNLAFGLLLGAVAVAAALAFGLGARDVAGRHVERWVESRSDTGPPTAGP